MPKNALQFFLWFSYDFVHVRFHLPEAGRDFGATGPNDMVGFQEMCAFHGTEPNLAVRRGRDFDFEFEFQFIGTIIGTILGNVRQFWCHFYDNLICLWEMPKLLISMISGFSELFPSPKTNYFNVLRHQDTKKQMHNILGTFVQILFF